MLSEKKQEILTRVGPGTPMGKLLRCYWMPIAISSDLKQGKVRKVRILCEELVLYRDMKGRLGLLEEHCPHRRTSFEHGCIDEEGIRCPYHGWKFDLSGKCLEMPAEPKDSKLPLHIVAKAYPVEELGGLIFAYLGTKPVPLLPRYDLYVWENALRDIGVTQLPCNWLQIMENSVDPHHVEWLHGHHLAHVRASKGLSIPTHYRKRQVKVGFDLFEHGIIKRRVIEGGSEQDDDWKTGHPLIFPNMLRVGSFQQNRFQIRVPVDDTHTMHYWYSCYRPTRGVSAPKQNVIPSYKVPWKDEKGDFLVDFVDGQDMMSWITQGEIADRTRENLGSSDRGIVMYRRLLLEQMNKVQMGEDPLAVIRNLNENKIIDLPQEKEKFGQGADFLKESMEMSHVRYSPIKDIVLKMLSQAQSEDD